MAAKGFTKEEMGRAEAEVAQLLSNSPRQNVSGQSSRKGSTRGATLAPIDSPGKSSSRGSTWKQAPDPKVAAADSPMEENVCRSSRGSLGGAEASTLDAAEPVVTWAVFQRAWMLQ
jgi:hypothetical protein